MGLKRFELIFSGDSVDDAGAVKLVLSALDKAGCLAQSFRSYEKDLDRDGLQRQVEETRRFPTDLHVDGLDIQYGGAFGRSHRFLIVTGEMSTPEHWDAWVATASGRQEFVLAWVTDHEFDFWQNAHDPLQYTSRGRDYENLPMVASGDPPPLDRMLIDTSRNPGRRVLRDAYVEGIGYTMWLSPLFWQHIGRSRDDAALSAADWKLTSMSEGMLRIAVPAEVFSESGDCVLQERLRSALYG